MCDITKVEKEKYILLPVKTGWIPLRRRVRERSGHKSETAAATAAPSVKM